MIKVTFLIKDDHWTVSVDSMAEAYKWISAALLHDVPNSIVGVRIDLPAGPAPKDPLVALQECYDDAVQKKDDALTAYMDAHNKLNEANTDFYTAYDEYLKAMIAAGKPIN